MRPIHAHLQLDSADGRVEIDLFSCAHCQRQVKVKGSRGWCHRCAAIICVPCARAGECQPFEIALERAEARGRLVRSILG